MAGVVRRRDADVEKGDGEDRDSNAALGPLAEFPIAGKGSQDEADQGDDQTETGDQGQHRSGVVGQMDQAQVDVGRQAAEVRHH